MKRLVLVFLLLSSVACFMSRPTAPTVYLPTFEPLPEPPVLQRGPSDSVCMDLGSSDRLDRRLRLLEDREKTLMDMLKALGAKEPPRGATQK